MHRIGIDVGGTFTDFTLVDEKNGAVHFHKLPSTPGDPSEAIDDGIAALLAQHRIAPDAVSHIGHGTTVATNLIIERKGARAGLITTQGFRDILEIGRQARPHLFDYSITKPVPLVARQFRIEVGERITAEGTVVIPLDEAAVRRAAEQLLEAGITTVSICFLHSYRNPAHERRARVVVLEVIPEAYVSISSDVLPEFREFERLSTTVLNSAVGPRMKSYQAKFLSRIAARGIQKKPFTMHSNGGLMSAAAVSQYPVRTCLSGPAAGVVGAAAIGRAIDRLNLVTFDVGGTSTDVSLIHNGQPLFTSHRQVAAYPVKMPMIDIHVIGAGGGSIAWTDDAGSLKVGPQSAGALPGPAAYLRGGTLPTITDAQIALHRLNPKALLGGEMKVDAEQARQAILKHVAVPFGLSLEDAAEGIVRIANANMSRAIRSVSTERGYDLSRFALFAFGGAGPLHAVEVAEECGIPTLIIPQEPGTMCARGMLLTDVSFDFVRTAILICDTKAWRQVVDLYRELQADADGWLSKELVTDLNKAFRYVIDARYEGQNFEVQVAMAGITPDALEAFERTFHEEHNREYGYKAVGRAIQIVNCRLQAIGKVVKAPLAKLERSGSLQQALTGERQAYLGKAHGWVKCRVYARDAIAPLETIPGPSIIEEMSSTTVLGPNHSARVDAIGNLIVEIKAGNSQGTP